MVMVGCGTQIQSACAETGWTDEDVDALVVAATWAKDAGVPRDVLRMEWGPDCLILSAGEQPACMVCLDAVINSVYD